MITKEMIEKGFKNNLISLEDEFGGCTSLCCRIGDNAFYFAGYADSELIVDEYKKQYTTSEIIDFIYDILKDKETAKENGLDEWEIEFYELLLTQEK